MLALTHVGAYNGLMKCEWDQEKAAINFQKHLVNFADIVTVLEDDAALRLEDQYSDEERFVTVGMDALGAHSCRCLRMARREHSRHFGTQGYTT